MDYSLLDPVSAAIFHPRADRSRPPAGALELAAEVAPGVSLGARFHALTGSSPNILLFHGNAEVVGDYDEIAADYRKAGAGLLVVDFRGYGRSGGEPRFSSMLADAPLAAASLCAALDARGFAGPWFAMGRSLGTHCALELAARAAARFAGLIVESGSGELARLARLAGLDPAEPALAQLLERHDAKLRSIELPLLAIHGERDELIPLADARALVERLGSSSKRFEVIPGAGHNDLWWVGR
ncbi:MAG TPA: alpha/beta fold hydrolase, partial [Myxococcota bacterium]|nr:alpha/beta fold hydrolase [Myxococcota bacterium]